MARQESTASTTSVHPEIIENQDFEFANEITNVDTLYFSNTETYELKFVGDDGESDSANDENVVINAVAESG